MDHKTPSHKLAFVRKDVLLIGLGGIVLLVLAGWILYDYLTPEWVGYQAEFKDMVAEKFGDARAATVPHGLQQVYVKELNVADRCVTCHLASEWKGFENAPEPFRTHPREILAEHPVNKYGCTPCHGGQGYATNVDEAHGFTEHWDLPLLGSELGDYYVVNDRTAMLQMNCNSCHRYDKQTLGASFIDRAKSLVLQKGCRACHVINGRGGTVGPDLTDEGDKSVEQFDYERLEGLHSNFSWHVAHFKDPKAMSPGTVMPNFGFSTADAQALALLVMSWKKTDIPIAYIPNNNFKDIPTPEETEREERMSKGPGAFFVKHNCFLCHSVSTLGIEAAAQIGPDLALAVEDVHARFGRPLEDFLMAPTGTMEVVLGTMIQLSHQERLEAIQKLHEAYDLKVKTVQAAKKETR